MLDKFLSHPGSVTTRAACLNKSAGLQVSGVSFCTMGNLVKPQQAQLLVFRTDPAFSGNHYNEPHEVDFSVSGVGSFAIYYGLERQREKCNL